MTYASVRTSRVGMGILFGAVLLASACGGAAGEGAKSPVAKDSAEPDAGQGSPAATTEPATTTSDLADASAPVALPAATSAGASDAGAAKADGHAHEPGRNPSDIRASVVAHRDQARACYEKGLTEHPGIEGDLVIQWTIDPKGNVSGTSVDTSRSQIAEPGVITCVSGVIKKLQFAPSAGGYETKAYYPFNFHPHHGTHPTPAP